MRDLLFGGEFAVVMLAIVWTGLLPIVMLTSIVLWGWIGLSGCAGANLLLAYRLNQARNHNRSDLLDDRLTSARMEAARNWLADRELDTPLS